MKIAVLGGLGMQGKAALLDLARSGRVHEIICADVSLKEWDKLAAYHRRHQDQAGPGGRLVQKGPGGPVQTGV